MPYDLGAVVPLGTTVRDGAGALANAGSMTLAITLPDSTTVTVSPVTPASTGTYTYDYTTTQAGRHTVRWLATGVNAGAYTDVFDVSAAASTALFSLAEAKRHLNLTTTTQDDEVREWIATTTEAVEFFVGPVIVRSVTEDHHFTRASALVLRQTPVLEVTMLAGILTGGTSYLAADLALDSASGVVQRLDGATLSGPLRITYTAGRRVVPPAIRAAAKIILQHLWRTQQGPGRPQRGLDDFDVNEPIPGLGYAIPNRAMQLLSAHQLPPAVA
ncbi:hypothetical protein [Streptomyces sp. NPDC051310]|uniref:hypothetical protein n=1 Tax=Streptomyces sp. NPDC051310 TaxID=3365649 RepID=UPI0037AB608E